MCHSKFILPIEDALKNFFEIHSFLCHHKILTSKFPKNSGSNKADARPLEMKVINDT